MERNGRRVWFPTRAALYQSILVYHLFCAALLALIAWQVYLMRVRRMRTQFSAVLQGRNRIAREIHGRWRKGSPVFPAGWNWSRV
ncbi:MAG: hypothetical protein WKF84_05930 [Pyrinomonadaceae bacterium]